VKITLKAARVNADLTIEEASQKIGISENTLINWEKNRTFPKPEQIKKICEVYNCPYSEIIFFKE